MSQSSSFIRRFDRIWTQARRVQLWQALCWMLLAALAGLALLTAADYTFELARPWRLSGAIGLAVAASVAGLWLAIESVRRWQRNATAGAIERVFPQLGQRIRTTVQYGELSPQEIQQAGVTGTLVAALEDDTVRRAQPLPLDAVVPWKSLALASLLAAAVGLLLAGASAFDWQWRIAAKRALLGEEPYTRLTVTPGSTSVKEGESLAVQATVAGRLGDHVLFQSRRLDDETGEWRDELLPTESAQQSGERQWTFEAPLERIRRPLEYRFVAASATSEIYRVDVRYPLKIANMRAAVQPPAYTRLKESMVEGGDIAALVGSQVKLTIKLDREPQAAWIEMQDARRSRDAEPPRRTPLAVNGLELSTEFEVTGDKTFAIVAQSADGMELADNKHRLRARQDEAPQVWFESPSEALEVHTLAEVLMRIRVSDDFGLSRAGIMFEVNNEEEYPLLAEDFDFEAAAEELQTTGELTPKTREALEKVLPLEHFQLSQQDSVMYYAFAEDIRPGSPQRTETDLRFVDIRPFRRTYRLVDFDGMGMGQGVQLKTLEELIARQRYALNRGVRLSRTFEHTGQIDLAAVDSLTKFEGELAKATRELAEGLEARGIDDTELLYQAEASMLGATDSLSAGKYDTATLQMRDALKELIEGRDRVQFAIEKNPDKAQLAALRMFDRLQRQKLRKPKTDAEEAEQLAERLKELADREDFVYATLAGLDMEGKGEAEGEGQGGDKSPKDAPPEKRQKDDGQKDEGQNNNEEEKDTDKAAKNRRVADAAEREDLEDRQLDVSLEARELEQTLGKLKGATDLAKERMAAAAKSAEEAAAALDRGAGKEAEEPVKAAGRGFRELSEQVAALAAKEQADRIAAAQQMAADLAKEQNDFEDRLAQSQGQSGSGGGEPMDEEKPMPGKGQSDKPGEETKEKLADDAQQIADKAETLADVLAAAAKSDRPEDQASAKKVEEMVGSLGLKALTQRLADLPETVRNAKLEDARATVGDGAERMEAAAEQLAVLRRAIVAPRVDELADLEQKLAALDERLDELDTNERITGWHVEADQLLERLDEAGVDEELRQEFLDEMKQAGWDGDLAGIRWAWGRREGGYYAAPVPYRRLISRLSSSLRAQMQELMLGDLLAAGDEPIPPQYQDLVDRYYQVLAGAKAGARGRDSGVREEK
ncbi:MAG TPA: DUF4175 family protein [Pirellulales bacterium]|nr:DUF4175 family protein [Pirellulales bacterium]